MDSFHGYTSLQTGIGQQGLQSVNTSNPIQTVSSDAVLQLQPGDTFQGEIMSVNGQEVQLQLANGMYMVARLEGDVQLALGQLLNFQVQSNQNSKIILKPIYTNLLQQRVGEAALKAANLAVTDKNLQLVSKLIENGMPIDKSTLALFNRQLLQHPQANIDSLIRLHQLGVKITDVNLTQLEHYQNMEHKLLDGIQEAVDEIQKLYKSIVGSGIDMASAGQCNSLGKAGDYMQNILRFLANESIHTYGEKQVIGNANQLNDAMTGAVPLEGKETSDGVIQHPQNLLGGSESASLLVQNGVVSKESGLQREGTITLNEIMNQLENMSEEQITDKLQSDLKQGNLDVYNLKELLLSEKGLGIKLSLKSKDKLYCSEEFRSFLKDTLQKEWSLAPEELTENGKIKEFYQKLMQQSEKLSQIMEQAASQSQTNVGNALQNIRENVEFMNQMNQMFQYVQLPLKLSGSQAQGELYIYTNKRNLTKKEGILTAIMHLDMEHLGDMDINISLNMDTAQVITRFYIEDDVIPLLEEHMEKLSECLRKKGYYCNNYVEKRESEKTVFEQIQEHAGTTATPLIYQNFDIRT